jgi:hypothetical protein
MILRKFKAQIQKLRIHLVMLKRKAQVLYLRPTWSFKKEKERKKSLSPVLEAHLVILKRKSSSSILRPMLKEWFRNPK